MTQAEEQKVQCRVVVRGMAARIRSVAKLQAARSYSILWGCAPRRRERSLKCNRPPLSSSAAQEMRVGPSDSDCRIMVQTTASRSGTMAGWRALRQKAGKTRQVSIGKANASEPLMKYRKESLDVAETRSGP